MREQRDSAPALVYAAPGPMDHLALFISSGILMHSQFVSISFLESVSVSKTPLVSPMGISSPADVLCFLVDSVFVVYLGVFGRLSGCVLQKVAGHILGILVVGFSPSDVRELVLYDPSAVWRVSLGDLSLSFCPLAICRL